jgi:predicted ATPase/DNA-binding CsgD family transcriptional regulator
LPRDALLGYLAGRRLLLILDNCEHLIDACAALTEEIISSAPGVTVLATSREPLDVAGETTLTVSPLPVGGADADWFSPHPFGSHEGLAGRGPGGGTGTGRGADGAGDAVELFARRAAAAVPGFTVTDANRHLVTRICRGVDGLPLAIEMAAGRLRDLSLPDIARHLDHRLILLTGGGTGDGGRHATVRGVLAWSYDTCTTAERALWARLSVLPGTFGVDAAAEVCASAELSGPAVFETIIGLVNKSVLTRVDAGGDGARGDEPAFRLLDTVRDFGAERLAASGDQEQVRNRLVGRYLAMARQADKLTTGGDQLALFAALHREHASVRAALECSLDAGTAKPGRSAPPDRTADGAELATRLWAYWLSSGLMAEGRYWLGRALDRVAADDPRRAWAHVARSLLAALQGDAVQAVADGRAAVALAESLRRPPIAGRAQAVLCLAYTLSGQLDAAARAGKAAERLLTAAGDTDGLIVLDTHLAMMCAATGKPQRGITYYQRGIARFGEGGGERMYHGYLHLAGAFSYLRLPGREADCARALSLTLMAKYNLDEVTGTAYGLELLGWLAERAGRHQRAAWLLGAAEPLWAKCGARLSNAAAWERRHAEAVVSSRAALGAEEFAALFDAGAGHPRDQVVALAINDADSLDGPAPRHPRPGALALSEREREIAYLAAAGLSVEQVSDELFLPPAAVAAYLASVFGKLGVSSAAQLGPWLGG